LRPGGVLFQSAANLLGERNQTTPHIAADMHPKRPPMSFRQQVKVALGLGGCENTGRCHR